MIITLTILILISWGITIFMYKDIKDQVDHEILEIREQIIFEISQNHYALEAKVNSLQLQVEKLIEKKVTVKKTVK